MGDCSLEDDMTDKQAWMEGYQAGMKRLAQLIFVKLGGPRPPSIWDEADQKIADQDWEERT